MNMASPSDARLGQVRHMFMFLGEKPPGKTFGGPNVTSIFCDDEEVKPFTAGKKEGCYHTFRMAQSMSLAESECSLAAAFNSSRFVSTSRHRAHTRQR